MILGFPLTVHWSFWLSAVYFSLPPSLRSWEDIANLMARVAVIFVAVLAHELGHAWWMRHFGARTRIVLHALGGQAVSARSFTRGQETIIFLAGPLAGLLLWLLCRSVRETGPFQLPWVAPTWQLFQFVNLWWSLLNLVPALPLDGGRILASILGRRGRAVTGWIGVVSAAGVCWWSLSQAMRLNWTLIFFGYLVWLNLRHARGRHEMRFSL